MATAQFPTTVWDGTTPSRSVASVHREGDGFDWEQLVAEIVAVQTRLTAGLNGTNVATVANGNVIGGVPVLHRVDIANTTGDTLLVLTNKTRITDVWTVKGAVNGGAGDTVTVKNGSTAITDAISLNKTAKLTTRCASIDPAQQDILAGGTITISGASSTNCACIVYILGVRIP